MEIEKIVSDAPDMLGQAWGQRIDYAASVLFVHGYITQSARAKVTQKLEKQYADGIAAGRIVPRDAQFPTEVTHG